MNGCGAVVCAEGRFLSRLREKLAGKDCASAMAYPLGNYVVYFLPDCEKAEALSQPVGFSYEWYEGERVQTLYAHKGFHNALSYDPAHARPDVIALAALKGDTVAGIAAASIDCAAMWQIGIDVTPAYRGAGLAAALVNRLTEAILKKDIVPYYGANYSNIASQRTALLAGYRPVWAHAYGNLPPIV